jgi:hypothetical protein
MLKEVPLCLQPAALEVLKALEYNSPVLSQYATAAREVNSLLDITRSYFHIRIALKPSTPQPLGLDVGLLSLFQSVVDETARVVRLCEILRASVLNERSKAVDSLSHFFSVSKIRRRRKKPIKKLSDLARLKLQPPILHSHFDSADLESVLEARWAAEVLKLRDKEL